MSIYMVQTGGDAKDIRLRRPDWVEEPPPDPRHFAREPIVLVGKGTWGTFRERPPLYEQCSREYLTEESPV